MAKKRFYFRVEVAGVGATEEEAWQEAVENFHQDPGYFHECVDRRFG